VHPAALQLRLLQTVVEVAAEKNSTLVLPFPVELLRFLERATPPETTATPSKAAPPAHPAHTNRPAPDSPQRNDAYGQAASDHRTDVLPAVATPAAAACAVVNK
jgi:hypothetical protein